MRGLRGGTGAGAPPPPLNYHKAIGFLSNIGPKPGKIKKLQDQHSMLGHHRPASEPPFKLHDDGPIKVVYLDHIFPHQLKNEKRKKSELNLTPSDKTFSIHACKSGTVKNVRTLNGNVACQGLYSCEPLGAHY